MSWKNCEYVSQQKFLVQQIQRFVIAFAIAAILFVVLMYARLNGLIPNNATYGCLLGGLLLGFQIFNIPWMIGGIRRYKQLGELAKANCEPMRESVRQTMDAAIAQSRIVQDDGSVVYEAFRWNAGAWMGTCVGSLAWMLPLAVIAFWHGARLTSGIVFGCCVLGSIVGWKMWLARHRLPAYAACQILVGVVGVLVIVVFAALQFLTNEATQEACQWTPWAWALLFLMPAVSLQLRLTRQTFHRNVQQRIQETS